MLIFAVESKRHPCQGSCLPHHRPKPVSVRSRGYKFAASILFAVLMGNAAPPIAAATENQVDDSKGIVGLRGNIDAKGVGDSGASEVVKLRGLEGRVEGETDFSETSYTSTSYEPCPDGKATSIPFAMTDIEGAHDNERNQLRISSFSTRKPVAVYFLKDVTFCDEPTYVITGTKLTAEQFKAEIKTYLKEKNLDAVMYNIHGFNVEPADSFWLHGHRWKTYYEAVSRWLLIPVMWRSRWEDGPLSYSYDRTNTAIRAGKLFVHHTDVFEADYTTHMLTHSMGNWVYQVMAQNISNPEILFEKHFMVSADVRSDMFADGFNPDAPRTDEERFGQGTPMYANDSDVNYISSLDPYDSAGWQDESTCFYDSNELRLGSSENSTLGQIPVENCLLNGGYAISKLSKEIHVLWNTDDTSLALREAFNMWVSDEFMAALGKYGDKAESYMNLQYFKDKVTFHNMTGKTGVTYSDEIGLEFIKGDNSHGYHYELSAVQTYLPWLDIHCERLPCDSQVCEVSQQEVSKSFCWTAGRYSESCCKLAAEDQTDQVLSLA